MYECHAPSVFVLSRGVVSPLVSQQSGLVRMIRAQWRMTSHGMERLADRGVATTELIDLLLSGDPVREVDVAQDGKPVYAKWNSHIGVVFLETIDYETGDRVKLILSVYLNGQGKANWEQDAVSLAGKRRSMDVIRIEDMHEWVIDKTAPTEPKYKAAKKPKVAPVVTRNVYDEVPGNMMATARRMLRQMGLDPTDMRPVVVLGPNRIEIDPTRLKRAG